MLIRDSIINQVILGPRAVMERQKLLYVAGGLPVLMPATGYDSPPTSVASASSPGTFENNLDSPSVKSAKIPRPPNAFIIYRKAHHSKIVAENPSLHNNQICKYSDSLHMLTFLTCSSRHYWSYVATGVRGG